VSHLHLVTDPREHQFTEQDGRAPGDASALCKHCDQPAALHIARQCAWGATHASRRCSADASWIVGMHGRRIPFCGHCLGLVIDLAQTWGLGLTAEPIAPRGVA